MRIVLSIAIKDLRLLLRDRASFFFAFFWPVLLAVFFGSIFSGSQNSAEMTVLVTDLDRSEASEGLVARLDSSAELAVRTDSLDGAADAVRQGQAVAAITIPEGFGASASNPFFGKTAMKSDVDRAGNDGQGQGVSRIVVLVG